MVRGSPKWHNGVSVTLTPNPNWYGTKPTIQKVIFKIIADTAAEFQAFKSGEVLAIYPQPAAVAIDAIKGGPAGLADGHHHRDAERRGAVDEQRQVPVRLGARCARPSATRSTATRS